MALKQLDSPSWQERERAEAFLATRPRTQVVSFAAAMAPSCEREVRLRRILSRPPAAHRQTISLRGGGTLQGIALRTASGWRVIGERGIIELDAASVRAVDEDCVLCIGDDLAVRVPKPDAPQRARWVAWVGAFPKGTPLAQRRRAAERWLCAGEAAIAFLEGLEAGDVERARWLEWARRELSFRHYGLYE